MKTRVQKNLRKKVGGHNKINSINNFHFFSHQSYSAQNFQIIRDAEIELFLHKIIKSTIGESRSKNFHPRLILNSEYNALVTGSNKIYINTGLINKSSSLS